ncbi:MAG: efflux RND transporter periplasmic adaptor subunit [Sandaracinus sp.]
MNRTLLSVLLVLALGACHGSEPSSVAVRATAETTTITAPASTPAVARDVPATIELSGTLLADEESHVSPIVPGRVVEVLVERGTVVAEGDPLVRLRDTDYRLQLSSARASLDQARARLGMDEHGAPPAPDQTPEVLSAHAQMEMNDAALERAEGLAQRGVFTQAQLDEARARATSSRESYASALQNARASIAALSSAQTALRQASTSVGESIVRAPFAGEIASREVSPGEYVTAASHLVTLVRTDPLRIEVQIPQERIFEVREGQSVEVRVDATDHVFPGSIRYISASVDATSRGLVVEAVIPNSDPEHRLRPGMFAHARILLGHTESMASVPPSAVLTQAGVSRVFILRDGRVVEAVVSIAERDADHVVISQGVSPGDVVATERLEELADGMRLSS